MRLRPWLIAAAVLLAFPVIENCRAAETPAAKPALPELPKVLPPYLMNPVPCGMTVCFLAQGASNVVVAFGQDSQAAPSEIPVTGTAIEGTPWTVWKTRLSKLEPRSVYQYQVRYELAGEKQSSAACRFNCPDPGAKSVRFIAFNDLHNNDKTLATLMQQVKPDDYEFSMLIGDCLADPSLNKNAYEVFRAWSAFLRLLNASTKPVVYVRGNHETRSSFAAKLANLFDLPNLDAAQAPADAQWQFTMRAGPVYVIAMDTGEDDGFDTPETSYKNPKFWQAYRQRQVPWLKEAVTSKAATEAAWRIFVSHIPLYINNSHFSAPSRQYWEPVLFNARLDLELAGHDHNSRYLPGGVSYTRTTGKGDSRKTETETPPWPVLIGGDPSIKRATIMFVHADTAKLEARMLAADGKVLAEFQSRKENAK
jgi:hypothetical protein